MAAILRKIREGQGGAQLRRRVLDRVEEQPIQEKAVVQKHATSQERNQQSIKTYMEETALQELVISGIIFSLFDNKGIDDISVVDVENVNKSYDPSFSTDDPRMGTIDHNKFCTTCGKTNRDCVGHLGKLSLPVSIIHPFYRDYTILVLQTICFTCNKLLVTEKTIQDLGLSHLKGKKRLSAIAEHCEKGSGLRCANPHCDPRPIFTAKSGENLTRYVIYKMKQGKKEIPERFSVETIKMKLDAISDNDAKLLGFKDNHPRNFVVDFIPVIPPTARPYIIREGEKRDDYLTSAYCNIMNKKIESVQQEEEDKKEEVYKYIIEFYMIMIEGIKNNEPGFSKGGRKEVCKSIFDRVTKKDGIIRKYILGKRIDYSGRTVAGPNGTLEFNHLAIPRLMNQVTIPEIATIYNIERLNELSRKGEVVYICPKGGEQAGIKLRFNINRHKISIGDRVGRYTQEGDVVLFNRQPTLQLQSMIGQIVNFQDKGSVGLHLSSAPGLNADFDGDEGNVHFLQTTDAQVEGRLIMSASNCIISYSNSTPQAHLVYNSISGGYLLSSDDVLFTKDEFYEGIRSMRFIKSDFIERNLQTLFERVGEVKYTGKTLCSVLFPEDFWYKKDKVFISNGILRKGQLTKSQVGDDKNSIVQSFVKWYGGAVASDFISGSNFLFNWYVERSGMSVGLTDCIPEGLNAFRARKDEEVRILNNKVITLHAKFGDLGREEEIEKRGELINNATNSIMTDLNNIISSDNNLSIMKNSGAKGKPTGNLHMIGFRGQIQVGNFPPVKKLTRKKRWLTTFSVDDHTVFSTGFSSRSYLEGLEPNAFYAMAQEGRLNVIDRQLRTADTGYMQRRIIKAQEDLVSGYDGSVYSQTGNIVQFTYGLGFAVNEMVWDVNDGGEGFYSFINTRELCGRINTANGFKGYNTTEELVNIFNDVLQKYDHQIEIDFGQEEGFEEDDREYTIEEEFDESNYLDEAVDGGDDDFDFE